MRFSTFRTHPIVFAGLNRIWPDILNLFHLVIQGVPPLVRPVSTSTNSTSTNFSAIGIRFVLAEFVISKFVLVEFSLCTTQLVRISHSKIFCRSQKSY